jgi:hypothetical protein
MNLGYQSSRRDLIDIIAKIVKSPLLLLQYETEGFSFDWLVLAVQDPSNPKDLYLLDIFKKFPNQRSGVTDEPTNPDEWQVLEQIIRTWIEKYNGIAAGIEFPFPGHASSSSYQRDVWGIKVSWDVEQGTFLPTIRKNLDRINVLAPVTLITQVESWVWETLNFQQIQELTNNRLRLIERQNELQQQLSAVGLELTQVEKELESLKGSAK